MANQRIYLTAPGMRPFMLAKRMGYGFYVGVGDDVNFKALLNEWLTKVETECCGLDVIGLAYEVEPSVPEGFEPGSRELTDEEMGRLRAWWAERGER